MAKKKPILILQADDALRSQLTEILGANGFDVYGVEEPDYLLKALKKSPFPVVVVDANLPNRDAVSFCKTIREKSPHTAPVFTGASAGAHEILGFLRAGAVDFIPAPFNPRDVVERLEIIFERQREEQAERYRLQRRVAEAEQRLKNATRASGSTPVALRPNDIDKLREFVNDSLKTLLTLERRIVELQQQLDGKSGNSSEENDRRITGWVAHSDDEFTSGVLRVSRKAGIAFEPIITGGEVLDRLGNARPDLILLGASLPDIPGQFVAQTVKAQDPTIQVLVVEGWGTKRITLTIVGESDAETIEHKLRNAEDLLRVLKEVRTKCLESDIGRELVGEFKRQHEDFLRRYAEAKQIVGNLPSTS